MMGIDHGGAVPPIELLWAFPLVCVTAALAIGLLRRALPTLPEARPPGDAPPPVVLLKPVLSADAATLERCRAWIASAATYPGAAAVVFSSVDPVAEGLRALEGQHPSVEVRVCSCPPLRRRREPGLDKAHRLTAAEAVGREILAGRDGIFVSCDEDVEPLDPRSVERLAAAAPRPGIAATVTNALALTPAASPLAKVGALNMAFNNEIYALAEILVGRIQGVVLGWTLVVWASDLRAVGGFASAATHLTEEVALGVGLAARGVRTRLFDDSGLFAVREQEASPTVWWQQQVRWRAQLRACPVGVLTLMTLLLPFSVPVLASTATLAASPGLPALLLLVAALLVSQRALGIAPGQLWLLPCHEVLTLSAQLAGMLTRRVHWGRWVYRTDLRSRIVEKRWQEPEQAPVAAGAGVIGSPQEV